MKKILILFVGALLTLSCSSDSETTEMSNRKTKNGQDIGYYYDQMKSSPDYQTLDKYIDVFVTKMNYDGNLNDLKSGDDVLKWISDNTSKTSFPSLSAANSDWQDLNTLQETIMTQNDLFYTALKGSKRGVLIDLIPPTPPLDANASCAEVCGNSYEQCLRGARLEFEDQMELNSIMPGDYGGAGHELICKLILVSHNKECKRAAHLCVIGCNN